MKKFIVSLAVLLPLLLGAVLYFTWFAPKQEKSVAGRVPEEHKPMNLISEGKTRETGFKEFGAGDKEEKEADDGVPDKEDPIKASKGAVEKYIQASGIGNEFHELDNMLDQQIEQLVASSELSELEKEKIARIFVNHINGDKILDSYKEAFAREFSDEEAEKLLEINSDPIVKRVSEEAQMKGDPEQMREQVEEYFKELNRNPLSKEREDMVLTLAKSGKNAEFLADVTLSMVKNLGQHLGAGEKAPSKEELETFHKQISEEAFGNVVSALAYQTRGLEDYELKHYENKKNSDLAKREDALRKNVARQSVSKLFGEIGKSLHEEEQN